MKELACLHNNQMHMSACHKLLAESNSDINDLPNEVRNWGPWSFLLALRGFLACGVVRHCLTKRHRVDYGVNKDGKKQLAVPFRACDTPSDRSEYGHPDVAIGLTMLTWYYDGLTPDAVKDAFQLLPECGPAAQNDIYNSWLCLSAPGMNVADKFRIDDVLKIDLSNEHQLCLLVEAYQYNMIWKRSTSGSTNVSFHQRRNSFPRKSLRMPGTWQKANSIGQMVSRVQMTITSSCHCK